jgi:hypothetical protein
MGTRSHGNSALDRLALKRGKRKRLAGLVFLQYESHKSVTQAAVPVKEDLLAGGTWRANPTRIKSEKMDDEHAEGRAV